MLSTHKFEGKSSFWDDSRSTTFVHIDRWSFDETMSSYEGLEGKLSPIHWSTSTSTTASSEDRLASFYRSHVFCMYGRRLSARQAQRQGRPAEQRSSKERRGVAQSC